MACGSAQEEAGKERQGKRVKRSAGAAVWRTKVTVSSRFDCTTSNQRSEEIVFTHICGNILAAAWPLSMADVRGNVGGG